MWGDRARSALAGTRFADVRWVAETGSTNSDLLGLARDGAPAGTVLVADHQRAGRGRLDRSWQAPPGSSLLVSILFRPALDPADLHMLTTVVALAARAGAAEVAGVTPGLKWPNDLVDEQSGGKVGGVLAESVVEGGTVRAVVVGIGLNVNWPPEVPAGLQGIAVALNHLVGRDVDREDMLVSMLGALDRLVVDLDDAGGRESLMQRYRDACCTIGQAVRVELAGDRSFVGRATGVDAAGRLIVDAGTPDAPDPQAVAVGDVVHLHHR